MKVMAYSQTTNPMLCEVKPYPLLEDNDEHIERKKIITTKFVPFHLLKMIKWSFLLMKKMMIRWKRFPQTNTWNKFIKI